MFILLCLNAYRLDDLFNFNEYVLPYNTFCLEPSYSEAYKSDFFCDRRKLFAVLNLPVNCL